MKFSSGGEIVVARVFGLHAEHSTFMEACGHAEEIYTN